MKTEFRTSPLLSSSRSSLRPSVTTLQANWTGFQRRRHQGQRTVLITIGFEGLVRSRYDRSRARELKVPQLQIAPQHVFTLSEMQMTRLASRLYPSESPSTNRHSCPPIDT
jgi:hypothetical protein